ncbi:MAG: 2'-5' RNA ligase [Candidatus Ornithomonoglobus sp.]
MTIGKFKTVQQMKDAYEDVQQCTEIFTTVVDTISVEEIGEHGESIIEFEISF